MCNKKCETCIKKCRNELKINQNNIKMEQNKTKKHGNHTPAIGFAVLIILFGVIMLLTRTMGWSQINPIVFSWEMLLFVAGVIMLFNRHLFSGLAFLGTGVFFILPKLANLFPQIVLPDDFISNYWGALVIYIGILLLLAITTKHRRGFTQTRHFKPYGRELKWKRYGDEIRRRAEESKSRNGRWFSHSVAFSDNEHIFLEPQFDGGETNVAFGDSAIDLRKTEIADGVTDIFINVAFGNCSLFVPQDWVILTGDTKVICGKITDKRIFLDKKTQEDATKTLNVIGSIVFGNLDLRN